MDEYIINPKTGRKVKRNGAVGKQILAEIKANDPETIRRIEEKRLADQERHMLAEKDFEETQTPIIRVQILEIVRNAEQEKVPAAAFAEQWAELINKYYGRGNLLGKIAYDVLSEPECVSFIDKAITIVNDE